MSLTRVDIPEKNAVDLFNLDESFAKLPYSLANSDELSLAANRALACFSRLYFISPVSLDAFKYKISI